MLLAPAAGRAEPATSAREALEAAARKELHADPYWEILLHYRETRTGWESLIDDPRFFLSPRGKHDPQAELEATIKSFYEPCDNSTRHPSCRFIARHAWLSRELAPDGIALPGCDCEAFNAMMRSVNPKAVTLIFPAAFMNNPASLFGHTLLNIETASSSKLLSHAVNYSAVTRETNGLVFAAKGIFGFYKAYFSVLPYYAKVQEYSDLSQRDMWEYRLNLTPQEVRSMMMHLWEMQNTYAYYYFFDENCSYDLLFLLDAARPSLGLTDRFRAWVIPIDTIKAIRASGVIAATEYRPSKATKIKHLASLVGPDEREQAKKLATGAASAAALPGDAADPRRRIITLDLAVEYLQYRYVKKELKKQEYADLYLKLLTARSRLGKPLHDPEPAVPPQPEDGHPANRLGLGLGARKGHAFTELSFRPAYHDLLDRDAGYTPGSHIQFCSGALRYDTGGNTLKVHRLDLIDIVSLAGRDLFFKPFSWKAGTGLKTMQLRDGNDHLAYYLRTGGGLAFPCFGSGLLYGMVEAEGEVTGALKQRFAIGAGPSAGIRQQVNDRWTILAGAKALFFGPGSGHKEYEATLSQNFSINRKNGLRVEMVRSVSFDSYATDVSVTWNYYF